MTDKTFSLKLFLSNDEIQNVCKRLANQIDADYSHLICNDFTKTKEPEIIAISILKGGVFFISDVLRYSKIYFNMDFVKLSSYGKSTSSSGTVSITQDISVNINDKHVLIFDEVVDSGRTLKFYLDRLGASSPKSVKICALIDKKNCRAEGIVIKPDYVGLEAGNEFLIGYGLDYAENFRNMPDIYQVVF